MEENGGRDAAHEAEEEGRTTDGVPQPRTDGVAGVEEKEPSEGAQATKDEVVDETMESLGKSSPFDETPDRGFVAERFFDFGYLEDETVERYWLNPPYAYTTVLYDDESKTRYYNVTEPKLNETEEYVRRDMKPVVKEELAGRSFEEGEWDEFDEAVVEVLADYTNVFDAGTVHKLAYYLMRDFRGYGEIDALLRDGRIEDISADGSDVPVFVYHTDYRDLPTNVVLDEGEISGQVRRLAQRAGEMISFSDPVVSSTLPDNHRVQLTLGSDIAPRGANFTIRLFNSVPFTPVDLIRSNTFSLEQMAFLWLAVEHRKSILFVGPTASGKTTSMNAVSLFIEPYSKVVTIEQTRELSMPHDNWVAGVTRDGGGRDDETSVTMNDLLGAALHQRPEYILVGEIRTQPDVLWTFLQSVFTGHAGSTTFHATDVEETVNRFRAEPFSLPEAMIASLDLVSIQRQVRLGDRRVRRCARISELGQDDGGTVKINDLFNRDAETDQHVPQDYMSSETVTDIGDEFGWNEAELVEEVSRRKSFLRYLVRNGISDYQDIWAALFAYRRDREGVVSAIDEGTFKPSEIKINYYD